MAGLAVAVAVVLAVKTPVHKFVKTVLTNGELNDGLILAFATLVILPQLPDRSMGPWHALNPSRLWTLVVLMLAVGAVGHIAARALGPRLGLPISGLASGFVSSTATIGSMASQAATNPSYLLAAVAGAALSTAATFVLMALLLFVVSAPTLVAIAPALAAGGIVAVIYGIAFALPALKSESSSVLDSGRAFSLKAALILAGTIWRRLGLWQ
jgi:uncharacterized membrane protein (DUF4010 family)